MAMPVFCAALTTVIAFAGLTAIGGRFGSLINDIPFTVIVVLIASLAECFFGAAHAHAPRTHEPASRCVVRLAAQSRSSLR